jgi:hypothetical protein
MDIVLIHVGGRVPRFLRDAVRQIEHVSGARPLVIGPRRAAAFAGPRLQRFRACERLSQMGLDGFWRYACERFFVLEDAMREAGIDRCLHLESDNLLYVDPAALEPWLVSTYGREIAICPVTDDEDTAAVLYAGSLAALETFNERLLELVALGPAGLLERHGGAMGNEMRMLHLLRAQFGLARALPTTLAAAAQSGAPVVFDAASYGQWVDGTPGAAGVPFAGDHHIVGRALLADEIELGWDAQRRAPWVRSTASGGAPAGPRTPLANLHVHSKRLALWTTPRPAPPPVAPGPLAPARRLRRRVAAVIRVARWR